MRQRTSIVAERLLSALRRKRMSQASCKKTLAPVDLKEAVEECPYRPLIFIAHCFGGLVVLKVGEIC
jgi:predicted alpha/beta hydrolase family esterase